MKYNHLKYDPVYSLLYHWFSYLFKERYWKAHVVTFLEPSTATSAQPRAELQDAGDENSAVSGICFETAQFRVGDENKTETKQNQPHVSNCQLWLGKGYKGFFLPLLLVVYLKSSVIKRIFSPPPPSPLWIGHQLHSAAFGNNNGDEYELHTYQAHFL